MMETGSMTSDMARALLSTPMADNTKVLGKLASRKGLGLRSTKME